MWELKQAGGLIWVCATISWKASSIWLIIYFTVWHRLAGQLNRKTKSWGWGIDKDAASIESQPAAAGKEWIYSLKYFHSASLHWLERVNCISWKLYWQRMNFLYQSFSLSHTKSISLQITLQSETILWFQLFFPPAPLCCIQSTRKYHLFKFICPFWKSAISLSHTAQR